MKVELWKVEGERREDATWVTLPDEICGEAEYIILPHIIKGSVMLATPAAFERFQESFGSVRSARVFLMQAVLAEVEEGQIVIPSNLAAMMDFKEEVVWCVAGDKKGLYHLVIEESLGLLLEWLERRTKA